MTTWSDSSFISVNIFIEWIKCKFICLPIFEFLSFMKRKLIKHEFESRGAGDADTNKKCCIYTSKKEQSGKKHWPGTEKRRDFLFLPFFSETFCINFSYKSFDFSLKIKGFKVLKYGKLILPLKFNIVWYFMTGDFPNRIALRCFK